MGFLMIDKPRSGPGLTIEYLTVQDFVMGMIWLIVLGYAGSIEKATHVMDIRDR